MKYEVLVEGPTDEEMDASWNEMFPDYQPTPPREKAKPIQQAVRLAVEAAKPKARKKYNPLTRRME